MTSYTITITFDFPGGVKTARPTVTTATTQTDTVASSYGAVAWKATANITDMDGLTIDDVLFYSDSAKRARVDPPCLDAGVWDTSTNTYTMNFNGTGVTALTTYYYDVQFRDNDMTSEGDWDPTLKIQPRSAENPPHSQQAGG